MQISLFSMQWNTLCSTQACPDNLSLAKKSFILTARRVEQKRYDGQPTPARLKIVFQNQLVQIEFIVQILKLILNYLLAACWVEQRDVLSSPAML